MAYEYGSKHQTVTSRAGPNTEHPIPNTFRSDTVRTGFTRREALALTGVALGTGALIEMTAPQPVAAERHAKAEPFRYCFNTSTIRGQKLPLVDVIEIVAKAGYHAIEPWIEEIEHYREGGGSLPDLGKRLKDHGITVESGIGFAAWIVDDEAQRAKGLEQAKRDMDMLAQIGGKLLAAPPVGATEIPHFDLRKAAERFRALLEVGDQTGIVPMAEVWGFSKTMQTLGEAAMVAIGSDHPKACILPDVYHMYKGGSGFHGLKLLGSAAVHVFHLNDYPAQPPRETITDADRVYPGDGIAPLGEVFRDLRAIGYNGVLSIELFNPAYYKQDPLTVAKTALEKLRAAVQKSA
jgi:2-keto-myo-inositol isomerase